MGHIYTKYTIPLNKASFEDEGKAEGGVTLLTDAVGAWTPRRFSLKVVKRILQDSPSIESIKIESSLTESWDLGEGI